MSDTPRSVRLFEALALGSIALGLIHQLAVTDVDASAATFQVALFGGLTLLVSRGRKSWARTVLLFMFVLARPISVSSVAALP